jgi:hypothetical protein
MQLLTKCDRKMLPKLYAQENNPNAKAYIKFFDPVGSATWYASEFDGEDLFFGFVDLGLGPGCAELGYFSLKELQSLKCGGLRLGIERDILFTPTLLTELIEQHKR